MKIICLYLGIGLMIGIIRLIVGFYNDPRIKYSLKTLKDIRCYLSKTGYFKFILKLVWIVISMLLIMSIMWPIELVGELFMKLEESE